MSDCPICCSTTNQLVKCQWCPSSACVKCVQRYITEQGSAICMNTSKKADGKYECRKTWTYEYMLSVFTPSWIRTKWRKVETQQELEAQRALYPEASSMVEREKLIAPLYKHIDEMTEQERLIRADYEAKIKALEDERDAIANSIFHQIDMKRNLIHRIRTRKARVISNEKCFSGTCPGFLNTKGECSSCSALFCMKCHELKADDHKCDANTVETIKALKKDTKPCPKCDARIFKIDGCDQMWCTQCHTAFSWRTGAIETRIHNPHYFQWLRENKGSVPRNPDDQQCGRELSARVARKFKNPSITEFIRKAVELNAYPIINADPPNNLELRLKLMRKTITEPEFARRVFLRKRAYRRERMAQNVVDMVLRASTDIIFNYADGVNTVSDEKSKACYSEIVELINYANSQLYAIAQVEKVMPWQFGLKYHLSRCNTHITLPMC